MKLNQATFHTRRSNINNSVIGLRNTLRLLREDMKDESELGSPVMDGGIRTQLQELAKDIVTILAENPGPSDNVIDIEKRASR